jgi:hypothetical protein
MWARHQDKLGSDLKTWAAAGAIPSMNYENTISFLTLVATICGLAFEYFGPEAPESSADARNDKAASQEAPPHCAPLRHTASKHFLVGLFRTPPPGASCRCCATRRRPTAFSTHRVYCT